MSGDTCNGWSNRPTWNVNLWLANEEPLYDAVCRLAALARDDSEPDEAAAILAESIREYVEEIAREQRGTFGDLDTPAEFAAVDYEEIAAAWLEE
jgi:hypothetical protein